MKIIWFVITTLIMATLSCKKDEELIHATIIYSNTIPGEGCGWLLTVDNMAYSPNNLDSAFMINSLAVLVSFDETEDSTSCGFATNVHYPIITIVEMKNH